jgi:sulfite reductase (NADPH) flavoprotein alpha-component
MLAEPKLRSLTDFISTLSKEELVWVNGYLSGLISVSGETVAAGATSTPVQSTSNRKITIAYGTETGNSKKLATEFAGKAKKNAVPVKLVSLDQYRLADLSKEEYFITVISTQGEGEPPIAAQKFYEHIHNNGFKIPRLKFGVLALGDTSYPMFCKTGEDVDTQLMKLGGNRIAPLQKCDLDYEEEAHRWFDDVLRSVSVPATVPAVKPLATPEIKKPAGKKIYEGTILSNINLNARGSKKTTYHIEIAAEDIEYVTGDSIGIVPENQPQVVEEIIAWANLDRNKTITWKNETATIEELLTRKIGLSFLLEKAVKQFTAITGKEITTGRVDLVDLLRQHPINDTQFEELLGSLNPIAPRIYNIASSPATHDGEVHIIVAQDAFTANERQRYGLCTLFLEDKKEGDTIRFFVQTNKRFRLPDADKDIIMIGPGTGIAPFRSFVAERDSLGATGRNWLFFGEDKFTTDFLYQTEWQNWFSTGVLTKISLAFTNGAEESFPVHQKIYQQAAELFSWLRSGATIYLCGEKEPMGKEVETTLARIFEEQGNMSKEAAVKYFEELKNAGRYVKDLY